MIVGVWSPDLVQLEPSLSRRSFFSGDYSATTLVPTGDWSFWTVQEYATPYQGHKGMYKPLTMPGNPLPFPALNYYTELIMPNTKSAERRMRNSARKHLSNRSVTSRLHTLEKNYLSLVNTGKKDEALQALRVVHSAFDKAAKTRVVHRATANRKKSRLALYLKKLK